MNQIRKRYLARELKALEAATIIKEGTLRGHPAKQASDGTIFVNVHGDGFGRYLCTRHECRQAGFDFHLHNSR